MSQLLNSFILFNPTSFMIKAKQCNAIDIATYVYWYEVTHLGTCKLFDQKHVCVCVCLFVYVGWKICHLLVVATLSLPFDSQSLFFSLFCLRIHSSPKYIVMIWCKCSVVHWPYTRWMNEGQVGEWVSEWVSGVNVHEMLIKPIGYMATKCRI